MTKKHMQRRPPKVFQSRRWHASRGDAATHVLARQLTKVHEGAPDICGEKGKEKYDE